jgi:hypothetical protein
LASTSRKGIKAIGSVYALTVVIAGRVFIGAAVIIVPLTLVINTET